MKKIVIGMILAFLGTLALANKENAFAYSHDVGPYYVTYFFHSNCPAKNSSGWHYAQIVTNNGSSGPGCWTKTKYVDEKKISYDQIRVCELGRMSAGTPEVGISELCARISVEQVYKWTPRPKASFD